MPSLLKLSSTYLQTRSLQNLLKKLVRFVFTEKNDTEVMHFLCILSYCSAVTIDGTLIEKSGLMTGGISGVEGKATRWDEKEVSGTFFPVFQLIN